MEQLFESLRRLQSALTEAGVEYRLAGGLAVFLHVSAIDPDAARMARDVNVAIRREDLEKIASVAKRFGFEYRHAAGVDMLLDSQEPQRRSAIHIIFTGERVRADYLEPAPDFSAPTRTTEGVLLASVADLVRMKLTSYRFRDRAHIVDLDSVGLITPDVESRLPEPLSQRLQQVRQEERQATSE